YHLDIVKDGSGAVAQPYTSKLQPMYDIVKISRKARKKLLSVMTSALTFELTKIDLNTTPSHLQLTQFVVENLAYFDYSTVDDLTQVIAALEKTVASIGVPIAHSIETEVF